MTSPSLLGQVTLGRLPPLFEAYTVQERPGGLAVTVHASPTVWTNGRIERVYYDLAGLVGRLIPVTFSDKAFLSGWYTVADVDLSHWSYPGVVGPRVVTLSAELLITRVGHPGAVDLESRLSGALTRTNAHAIVGERWHAPPPGHTAYHNSTGTPSTLVVTGAEGPLTIYRSLTVGVNPRWACLLAGYGGYRVRILDLAGEERSGVDWPMDPTGWEMHNALVRVRVDAGGLRVAAHDGTQWEEKTYTLTVGALLGAPDRAAVIRNEYECATVRLLWNRATPGRVELDLTVRRGARVVEGYAKTQPAATITVAVAPTEGTTAATGYITATANDAAGNRFLLGSAGAHTQNTGASSISKASATFMDFVAGSVVGGGSAPAGDQAANLMQRYIGATAERVVAVRR